jgi:hypothetical protein
MAGYRKKQVLPAIQPKQVVQFCQKLKSKLLDRSSGFGKEYLRHIVSEIRLSGHEVEISGSPEVLAQAVSQMKTGTSLEVPAFVSGWLPDLGSNQGPTD